MKFKMIIINNNTKEIAEAINQTNPLYKPEAITYFDCEVLSLREIGDYEEIFATESTITGDGWQILTCSVVEIINTQGKTRFPVEIGWC